MTSTIRLLESILYSLPLPRGGPGSSIIGPRLEISKGAPTHLETLRRAGKNRDPELARARAFHSKIRIIGLDELLITSICIFIEKFLAHRAPGSIDLSRRGVRWRVTFFNLSYLGDFCVRGFACLLKTIDLV